MWTRGIVEIEIASNGAARLADAVAGSQIHLLIPLIALCKIPEPPLYISARMAFRAVFYFRRSIEAAERRRFDGSSGKIYRWGERASIRSGPTTKPQISLAK
jgi:hypothetical protein